MKKDIIDEKNGDAVVKKNILELISGAIDQNKQLISYGFYCVAAGGAVLIIKSLKLFKQFKNISDIPQEFFSRNHNLFGYVAETEIKSSYKKNAANLVSTNLTPYIKLHHIPVVGKVDKSPQNQLSLNIIGVKISPEFVQPADTYLRAYSLTKVKVKIFGRVESEILCRAFSKEYFIWRKCIGSDLLRRGYGHFDGEHFKTAMFNKDLQNYKTSLLKQEKYAERKGIGVHRKISDNEKISSLSFVKSFYNRIFK